MAIRPSILQISNGLGDFATSYQWSVTINKPNAVYTPGSAALNLRCISSEVPLLDDTQIETSIRGHKVWQPGIHNYTPTITLTMAEDVTMIVNTFIKAWREACWQTATGVHQLRNDVKTTVDLVRLNRQDKPIWVYHLIGCFLAKYTQDTLGTENSLLRPTLVLQYDLFTDGPGETAPNPGNQ